MKLFAFSFFLTLKSWYVNKLETYYSVSNFGEVVKGSPTILAKL